MTVFLNAFLYLFKHFYKEMSLMARDFVIPEVIAISYLGLQRLLISSLFTIIKL